MHPLATPLLCDRNIVLCVGGGIAAYKSVYLLRNLVKAGASVRVAMTRSATEFVGELTFQTLSGQSVFTDLFDHQQDADIGHIRVADGADLLIVAPATANLMARLVAGMANDPVLAAVLAASCPILLAPAMNVNMWENEATRANVACLAGRGMHFVGPDSGFLACKWTGSGRLSEPDDILEAACRVLTPQDLAGERVVVAAGGTEEAIDPVRFLGNRSTGKMGYALARAAAQRGAAVELISGPGTLADPVGVKMVRVRSASDMHQAVLATSQGASIVIMAAAVADYSPVQPASEKLKKDSWGLKPAIQLQRTVDILAELGKQERGTRPYLVGFAAETQDVLAAAHAKLASKGCDLVVANDVSKSDRGFGSDNNAAWLVGKSRVDSLELATKDSIAHRILDRVLLDSKAQ